MLCMYTVSFKVRKAMVFQSFFKGFLSLVFNPVFSEFNGHKFCSRLSILPKGGTT